MTAAGVIGAIRSHGADFFAFGDLVQHLRQNGAVPVTTGGEFHSADVRSGGVHGQMHLAPPLTVCKQTVAGQRLASALNAMLARLPVTIAKELDALAGSLEPVALTGSLSTSRFSGPSVRRQGIWTTSVFCLRHSVE